jgi:hypothetical protein
LNRLIAVRRQLPNLPEASEHSIQIAIQEYLTLKGIYCWRNNSGALIDRRGIPVRFGKVGSSDILGISHDGRFLAIEIKKPKGKYKPTPAQLEFLEAIHKYGGLAGIATSIEDVDKILAGDYLIS